MSPKRLRVLAVAVMPAVLLLAGCAGSDPSTTGATAATGTSATASSDELDGITVTAGANGAAPTVVLPSTPLTVTQPEHRVVTPGTGAAITAEHKLVANYLLLNGRDGKPRASMWGTNPVTLPLAQVPQFQPLVGVKVGAQVLLAMPAADAVGPQGEEKLDIKPEDTLVYLIQPTSVSLPLTEATGTAVPPKPGLPRVKMGATPKDPATFTMPSGKPPTETVAQPLIAGKGAKVASGQRVRVTYTGVTWRDPKTPFDYSGKTSEGYAEFTVGQGKLIKAWDEELVGRTVGTRLLLVVPPKDGYGAQGSGEQIKGTDTLVFVLDILDAS